MYHDHHFHPMGYASTVTGLDLKATTSLTEMRQRLGERAGHVEGAIIGNRLDDESLDELRLPTRADLDEVTADRPMLVYRYCGHIAVANTPALRAAGVNASTTDPIGGSFDRDGDGTPNGILRETAVAVVSAALRPLTLPPDPEEILGALRGLPEMGLGSVTGMVSTGVPMWCGVGDELATLCELASELPIDVDVLVITDGPGELEAAAEKLHSAGGRVRWMGWKEYADGSLGGHTAAMYQPFADRGDTTGRLRLDPEQAAAMARVTLDMGGKVAIHAIGDRANDAVLDLYRGLLDEGAEPSRLRIEHASILSDDAIGRFADMGITASVQPAFLASEEHWLEKRLGADRMELAYRFESLRATGVRLLGGSDSPVETPDPTIGIRAAVDRHSINISEAVTPDQAEAMFSVAGLNP